MLMSVFVFFPNSAMTLRRPLAWNHDKMMAGCRDGLAAYV